MLLGIEIWGTGTKHIITIPSQEISCVEFKVSDKSACWVSS